MFTATISEFQGILTCYRQSWSRTLEVWLALGLWGQTIVTCFQVACMMWARQDVNFETTTCRLWLAVAERGDVSSASVSQLEDQAQDVFQGAGSVAQQGKPLLAISASQLVLPFSPAVSNYLGCLVPRRMFHCWEKML